MGLFKSTKTYQAPTQIMPVVVSEVCETLKKEQYEVNSESLSSGGAYISVTKGNIFHAILGLKTALKVTIAVNDSHSFTAEAGVGIFGQQAIPTAITMLVAWPVLIPQIWGLVQQSKLDDHVLDLIQQAVDKYAREDNTPLFCPYCGHKITQSMKFCGECGRNL